MVFPVYIMVLFWIIMVLAPVLLVLTAKSVDRQTKEAEARMRDELEALYKAAAGITETERDDEAG